MGRIAIIGAGVSGLTTAQLLHNRNHVKVFEKEAQPGGLIKCRRVEGSLFHTCGGHVFNSKRKDVLNWFWNFFNKGDEFSKAERNSTVFMPGGASVPYPIENHIYFFEAGIQKAIVHDLVTIAKNEGAEPKNFEEFLKLRFGDTLYDLYFQPYNEKVWRRDLKKVPLSWLEGKLPMPTVDEMIYNNINHIEEKAFVHSTFWYEKEGGSQLIANRLADGLDIQYNSDIDCIRRINEKWIVADEEFDKVVFCGNIKDLPCMLNEVIYENARKAIEALEYHGTTAVFCEIDKNPYSWIYQPSRNHQSHRIICTGNFSSTNNAETLADNRITATIEFTDEIDKESILDNLKRIPLNPIYLDHQYNRYAYPIQSVDTRSMIKTLKSYLAPLGFFFTGRFADWEYYNMDAAMGAAFDMIESFGL